MIEQGNSPPDGPPTAGTVDAGQAALLILGDRANLLIVRESFRRARRYQDFKERLGMSDAVLASRLRDLVDLGVLRTEQYLKRPPRFEYRLTDCGIDFWKTAIGIWSWERRWGRRTRSPLPELIHLDGGHQATVEFGCGGCSTSGVTARELTVDVQRAVQAVANTPLRRYRRASWKPAASIDLFSEIDPLLGDRWMVATLAATMVGVDRFADLQRALQISPALLSKRLAELVQHDVLERAMVADGGHHHHYRLLPKGLDLMPILLANFAWANRWFPTDGDTTVAIIITHAACGDELVPAWFCSQCGKEFDRSTMTFDISPPSRPSRSGHHPEADGSYSR